MDINRFKYKQNYENILLYVLQGVSKCILFIALLQDKGFEMKDAAQIQNIHMLNPSSRSVIQNRAHVRVAFVQQRR